MIYCYIDDPNDCFPSAKNSTYSVIIDITDTSVFDSNNYDVYYIVSVGDYAFDLIYSVSRDFSNVSLNKVALRNTDTQSELYSYWGEDYTQDVMNNAFCSTACMLMPMLKNDANERTETVPYKENNSQVRVAITSITSQNFEQVVDMVYEEYDESRLGQELFDMFFNETFDVASGITGHYIGTSYQTFSIPEYDFYSFYVFRVEKGENASYYLVPFNEYVTAPNVYEFVDGQGLQCVWIYPV